jgi:hypothetical protein
MKLLNLKLIFNFKSEIYNNFIIYTKSIVIYKENTYICIFADFAQPPNQKVVKLMFVWLLCIYMVLLNISPQRHQPHLLFKK